MMKLKASWLPVVALILSAPSLGQAATTTTWSWDFTPCASNCGLFNGGNVNDVRTYSTTVNGVTKTLTARALFVDGLTNPAWNSGPINLGGSANGKSTNLANQVKAAELKASTGANTTKAGLAVYTETSGLGIGNPVDGPLSGGLESGSPQHAIDNFDWTTSTNPDSIDYSGSHASDFLLLDFQEAMQLDTFQLGWTYNGNTDLEFFIGNTLPFGGAFTDADGTGNGTTITSLLANNWKQVSKTSVGTSSTSFGSTESGRYVLVSGALGGYNDSFKFDKISMVTTHNPTPGTFALLGIGIAGLAFVRRRSRTVVS